MTKIETQWTFGNFDVSAATQVEMGEKPTALAVALAEKGFLQLLQRVPSSNAEKAVAGHAWSKNKKGEPERPKDFKRNSIPYSEDTAIALADAFGTSVQVNGDVALNFSITDVKEHVSETPEARKMATEMADKVKGTPMMAALGLTPDADDATLIEACHKFLQGLRKARK